MTQNAIVKKVVGADVVEVSLMRQLACGLGCSSCEGCAQRPKEEILALASNPIGAKPGDWVEVEPSTGHSIGIAVLVFFIPCVFLLAGYLAGQGLGLGEMASVGTAAAGLAAGFVPALLLNRAIVKRKAPEFRVLGYLH